MAAHPPRDANYVLTKGKLTVAAAPAEQTVDVAMNAGCVLILEAIDVTTGKGLPGVSFSYEPEDQPNLRDRVQSATSWIDNPVTDAAGKLRAVVNPGKRKYFFSGIGPATDYQPVKDDDDPAELEPGEKLVELPEGKTVTVRFKLRKP
jgi:hypothetical protein